MPENPLSPDRKFDYLIRSPHEGTLVQVFRESDDYAGENCGSDECEERQRALYKTFWDGERIMPDIIDPNQIIRYQYECAGRIGGCAMKLVQMNRRGAPIKRIEDPSD
jgi:hypothetical protein